jgi:dihydropteroate synthase
VTRRAAVLSLPRATLSFTRPLLCAVVNVTPDSFSDGGRLVGVESAVDYALSLASAGADMLDVGGESTRPKGARAVGADEEIDRVVPVIAALSARTELPISVDTTKAAVAEAALAAGAQLVNDVSGGHFDPGILAVTERAGAAYILGHARGKDLAELHASPPPTWAEVRDELAAALAAMPGELARRTIVDPGLGFGKHTAENLEHLARAGELGEALACPVMVGPSRKRFLAELTGRPVGERDDATLGACLAAVAAGAHVLRVHEVSRLRDALLVFQAVRSARFSS